MKYSIKDMRNKFSEKGLKVTPQRVAILEAIYKLDNHPTANDIIECIRKTHKNIAIGTVYKVLETLVENGLIKKITTDKNRMRYDGIIEHHHHLYCSKYDLIEDYRDEELDKLLHNHFKSKALKDSRFKILLYKLEEP